MTSGNPEANERPKPDTPAITAALEHISSLRGTVREWADAEAAILDHIAALTARAEASYGVGYREGQAVGHASAMLGASEQVKQAETAIWAALTEYGRSERWYGEEVKGHAYEDERINEERRETFAQEVAKALESVKAALRAALTSAAQEVTRVTNDRDNLLAVIAMRTEQVAHATANLKHAEAVGEARALRWAYSEDMNVTGTSETQDEYLARGLRALTTEAT